MKILKDLFDMVKLFFAYILVLSLYRKKVNDSHWLICEKIDEARDNGYHFFMYVRKNHPEINIFYIMKKSSVDYQKIRKIGRIVEYGSLEHYVLYLTSSVLISSQTMPYPCSRRVCELFSFFNVVKPKKVWLQHGITKDILPNKGMDYRIFKYDILSCSSKYEKEFLQQEYGYPSNVTCLTGLCRYDNLYCDKLENQILIMPTFRSWLSPKNKSISNEEKKKFLKSEFYEQYKGLLKSDEFNNLLIKNHYKAVFYLHYALQPYTELFKKFESKNVVIATSKDFDVQNLLKESKLLITDYSSVFFDFAYMKKPEVFFQFDLSKYRLNHYKEGYFNYERNAFGDVCYSYDELMNSIRRRFATNMNISDDDSLKVDNFFEYNDCNNCKRTYDAIDKLLN